LRRVYEQLAKDQVLSDAVRLLEQGIASFSLALTSQPGTATRFAVALDIRALPKVKGGKQDATTWRDQRQQAAVIRIAALVLANAMMFEEVLAQTDGRVRPLQDFRSEKAPVSALADHWKYILDEINYYPIFNIALKLLRCTASDKDFDRAIRNLLDIAGQIVACRASLRHDLAGRIYHRILAEAKYLGAYYTSIPAAALLSKLALDPKAWHEVQWDDTKAISQLRIADLACGTGTLLMAAADVLTDDHIRASVRKQIKPKLAALNRVVNEEVLVGFDVLHSAVHLTASTLALRVPDTAINLTNLFTLPFAAGCNELGSLEFFKGSTLGAASLFAREPERIRGKQSLRGAVTLPKLDLCIMNPPFTSSRQPNLLFGSVPERERAAMQKKLKRLIRECGIPASITAGLAAIFVALADRYLKENGRLALVLPRAVLSGIAWQKTRALIEEKYHLEFVIVSHEVDRWNFSENTDLSEALVVAQKVSQPKQKRKTVFVNLWRNPKSIVEALALSQLIRDSDPLEISNLKAPTSLNMDSLKFGEAIAVQQKALPSISWSLPCAYAQSDLLRSAYALRSGELILPGLRERARVPVCGLKSLVELGPDPRDVYDGFTLTNARTAYAALWGHDAEQVLTMAQEPNQYLEARSEPLEGRKLRDIELLWPRAGRVLITMRSRLNTKRLTAVLMSRKSLSDVWWPTVMRDFEGDRTSAEKALVLWLNSTLGLLILIASREETQGAWVQFKKPILESMSVLDLRKISRKQLSFLADHYDSLAKETLLPLPDMSTDPVRGRIDAAISKCLALPDFHILRELLAQEPVVSLNMKFAAGGINPDLLHEPL